MLILVLFLSLAIFLLAGVPIAIALGCSSLLALVLEGNTRLLLRSAYDCANDHSLVTCCFYVCWCNYEQ